MTGGLFLVVMPGETPASTQTARKNVDGREKPGHDG
jgi:hypothetical protein